MNLPHPEPCDHHDASRDLAGQAPAISLFQWPGHAKGQVGSNTRHKPAPQCLPRSVVRRSCAISTATAIVYTRRLNCLYPKAQLFIPEGSILSLKTFAATPLPTLSTLSTCPLDASRR